MNGGNFIHEWGNGEEFYPRMARMARMGERVPRHSCNSCNSWRKKNGGTGLINKLR
jgi:hypothetical protein